MARRRFFAPPSAFNRQTVTLTGDEAKHLRSVLRLKPGDQVFVFDGAGKEFKCVVAQLRRDEVELDNCEAIGPASPESPLSFTLAVALLKGEKFDLVVQKATELGVTTIVPVTTRYADIQLRDSSDAEKRVTRWRRIAMEAAKQCGRAMVTEVETPTSFKALIEEHNEGARLLFSERDGGPLVAAQDVESVIGLVGSEGGWADEELSLARDAGWQIVTLGGRILRAETAAITISALIQHSFGDLK
ncbi:MAG TPA: 16S rRNA (uracil(1498)-N(3))-methyltransferase [Pyrinomonadaceae bacterium]